MRPRLGPLAGLLILVALSLGAGRDKPPAAGGVRLLPAMEVSPLTVVAAVAALRAIDDEAFGAELRVEKVLAGPEVPGGRLAIAWEERARRRAVRFRDGDRILVSLTALPGTSLWRQRLPDHEARVRTWTIAERGEAFLREPSPGGVLLLEHYLALEPARRDRNAGVGYLARLAEGAAIPLATSAVERLGPVSDLDTSIDPTSARRLVAALLRPDAHPTLEAALLTFVGLRRPEPLRAPLEGLAAGESLAPAPVYRALGLLDGGLPPALCERLLAQRDAPSLRAAGALFAPPEAAFRLDRLIRSDPDPGVRSAAVTRLVELRGADGIERAVYALEDPDPAVRQAALLAIGGLGDEAVPALHDVALHGSREAAAAAVGALSVTGGQAGRQALEELAESHPDDGIRMLASAAIGRPIGHVHE